MRARSRSSARSLPARIEMKTMLSMPRTISRIVSVAERNPPLGAVRKPSVRIEHGLRASLKRGGAAAMPGCAAVRAGAALGHLGEGAPGLGVLPHQGRQVERRRLRPDTPRPGSRRPPRAGAPASGGFISSSAMSPSSCANAERVEEARPSSAAAGRGDRPRAGGRPPARRRPAAPAGGAPSSRAAGSITLFARNLMRWAIVAIASACSMAAFSSFQNASRPAACARTTAASTTATAAAFGALPCYRSVQA